MLAADSRLLNKELNLVEVAIPGFHEELAAQGYVARADQMIDSIFSKRLVNATDAKIALRLK